MNGQVVRALVKASQLSRRPLSTSTVARDKQIVLDQASRDRIHPKLGNRDIVGWGFNGTASYADLPSFPCPAVRFKENTPDVMALREKEKGDWKSLTTEEKKALYRASFCQTFAEINAPTGEWKSILAGILTALGVTCWCLIFMKKYVYPCMPHTLTRQWQEDMMTRMLAQQQGGVEGISSQYDYERGRWKC